MPTWRVGCFQLFPIHITDYILILVLIVCLITDLRERRIYNKVLFPAIIIALVGSFFYSGWEGFLFSFAGFFVGLGLLLIPFLMGGMGAGDVKLLATVGAFKGTVFVFYAFLYTAIIGGVLALIILFWKNQWHKRIKYLFLAILLRRHGVEYPLMTQKKALYPYGVAIVCGVFLTVGIRGW